MCRSPSESVSASVKIEAASRKRNRPGIGPIRDVDIVKREESFHRAAQQGRVVARHGRDDQKFFLARLGSAGIKLFFKMKELATRPLPGHPLDDRDDFTAHGRRSEIERGLVVTLGQPLENFSAGCLLRKCANARSVLAGGLFKLRQFHETSSTGPIYRGCGSKPLLIKDVPPSHKWSSIPELVIFF